jgi:FtsZ-interacting cell division protein ZipA
MSLPNGRCGPKRRKQEMDTWVWIVLAVIVVAVLVVVAAAAMRKRRSEQLREGFGPEYDHVVEETGDRREAERELSERRKRHEELEIVSLSDGVRTRYAEEWKQVQARFVDEPEAAVRDADQLVQRVMSDRGYPVADDFERRAADVSVDHPDVVEDFREGHRLAGESDTESLRQAMVHFRSLFAQLLEGGRDREEVRS